MSFNLLRTEHDETQTQGTTKACRSCWRDDIHIAVPFRPFALGFLLIVTLGLILVIRPSRCICCGTIRIF
ncbi:MAG: hypothetical protein AB8B55_01845 [Mariniblastus sp.]